MAKKRKPKAINFELIPPRGPNGLEPEAYRLMREIREQCHQKLYEARIALAWRKKLKPDHDGRLILGKCVKSSDLSREFAPYDFVILLNKEVWNDDDFTEEKKRALIDHELCHAAVAEDEIGVKRDERGRPVFRVRKHDLEEFRCIVERHGCYKADLEAFADALLKRRDTGNLFPGRSETEIAEAAGATN